MMIPWLLGLMKTPALRGAQEVNPDERCAIGSIILVRTPRLCRIDRASSCATSCASSCALSVPHHVHGHILIVFTKTGGRRAHFASAFFLFCICVFLQQGDTH